MQHVVSGARPFAMLHPAQLARGEAAAQILAEVRRGNRDQQQVGNAGPVPGGTLGHLRGGREMQEADAAVVVRRQDGKVKVKQAVSLVGAGALGGAFWGMLIGLLFWMPWVAFGVYGIWLMARDPDPDVRWDGVVVGLVALTIAVVAVVWTAKNKGDYAFNRHMVPAVPWLAR